MKRLVLFTLALALSICASAAPIAVPRADAAVYKKDPTGSGYTPCDCICWIIFGKKWCFCICDDNSQTPKTPVAPAASAS